MPNDKKKMFPRKETGTVPKCRYRNNISDVQHDGQPNLFPNNLGLSWPQHEFCNHSRSSRRNHLSNQRIMDASLSEEQNQHLRSNDSHLNIAASRSSDAYRRDSVGTTPKCDNITKCPDKKQIEDKLKQIREYLRVTTSLMSSLKNNEDQTSIKERENLEKIVTDLRDSEAKLVALLQNPIFSDEQVQENQNMDVAVSEHMLRYSQLLDILICQQHKFNNICNTNLGAVENGTDTPSEPSTSGYQSNLSQKNELEEKVEQSNRKLHLLKAQQNELLALKKKAENQLRSSKQARDELLLVQERQRQAAQIAAMSHSPDRFEGQSRDRNDIKNDEEFDIVIKELEERLMNLSSDCQPPAGSENIQSEVDYLQDRLDSSNQLIQLLGSRDARLNSEHGELQEKMNELQTKKMHIDQLAQNLQMLNGGVEDEDIGSQVRKIVSMKQQLSKLKDMLEIVKSTESALESQNVSGSELEYQENANPVYTKTDNLRQNSRKDRSREELVENKLRMENNASQSNEYWAAEKQSNKSTMNIRERERVLAELRAKKRELEEIMYKQKDCTLLNNDVCSESSVNKSDMMANNTGFDGATPWLPMQLEHRNRPPSGYSSDACAEEDINEGSELNSARDVDGDQLVQPSMSFSYSTPNFRKRRESGSHAESNQPKDYPTQFHQYLPRTPERSIRSISVVNSTYERDKPRANIDQNKQSKNQLQKQLELIQSVCQSMIEQDANSQSNVRNNLSPSPQRSESYPPNNVYQVHPYGGNSMPAVDMPWLPPTFNNCYTLNDIANNQNMLAANTLQTQAFLLNTLNHCCQMLWFQQREISTLRSMISSMQERIRDSPPTPNAFPTLPTQYMFPPCSNTIASSSPIQPRNNNIPKTNQVPAACSLPNLNEPHVAAVHGNIENNMRSTPSARLLESSLNNSVYHNSEQPTNNAVLSGVNANIAQPLPSQIWNGQALNNQVAPGNRANNYWDNFRSYSRQNLLSTASKSNEGLQNATIMADRVNSAQERAFPMSFPFTLTPKLNMVHNDSSNSSEENAIPLRQLHHVKNPQGVTPGNKSTIVPPDVLNINHGVNQKTNEERDYADPSMLNQLNVVDGSTRDRNLNINNHPDMFESSEASGGGTPNVLEYRKKEHRGPRNRNEWHDDEPAPPPKSKLFEELRENVYKEVANLISANENRPHFLIQLFRDLQLINSEPLRRNALQSIQILITNSLANLEGARGINVASQFSNTPIETEQQVVQVDSEYYSLQPTIWQQINNNSSEAQCNFDIEKEILESDSHGILKEVMLFLNSHGNHILKQDIIETLKELIIQLFPLTHVFSNINTQDGTLYNRHFTNLLTVALEKYQGKIIEEVKGDLLKSISEILLGEFSFLHLIQENFQECADSNVHPDVQNSDSLNGNHDNMLLHLQPAQHVKINLENIGTPQMQNGDLAEADQSRMELEEEGAVGGIINILNESINSGYSDNIDVDETDLPKIDFPMNVDPEAEYVEQGLDEVPTRLTTNSNSSGRGSATRPDNMEHF